MNPSPKRPDACLRPLPHPPRPKSAGPRLIGVILLEIRNSPGGYADEARRTLASLN